jgi:RNA polymerase sigma-70 factor (ECF subfamily)
MSGTGPSRPAALASQTSEELAIAASAGDDDAAGELYRRVRSRARRAARAFCAESDADDAVAEGLTTALRRIRQLRDPAAVEAWMVRCVVRCAIDLSRRRQRRPCSDPLDGIGECRVPTVVSAADAALLARERESMAAVVRTLQPSARLLLYLRYDAGLSIQHIAAALGKPPGTIRRQCLEARRLAATRFLSGHLRPPVGACAGITAQLCRQPYRRPGARVRRRTAEHLRRCRACRDRQTELGTVLVELGHRPNGTQPRLGS